MIKGTVVGQRLTVQNPLIVADTVNYLTACFSFQTEGWEGLEKWAHFRQGELLYDIKLKNDGISAQEGLNLPAGAWELYLHGCIYENGTVTRRITTNAVLIEVQPSGILEGDPLPVTPAGFGEQLEARVTALENAEDLMNIKEEVLKEIQPELDQKISFEAIGNGCFTLVMDLEVLTAMSDLLAYTGGNPDTKVWVKNIPDGYYYYVSPSEVAQAFAAFKPLTPTETLPPWAAVLNGKKEETWVFTLEDGSTVSKKVVTG